MNLENIVQAKDGSIIWVSTNGIPILKDDGTLKGCCGSYTDITIAKKAESEILHLSYLDMLTGLYNSRFFEEEIKRLDTERQLPLSIIMGYLNNLNLTNDTFSHAAGDLLPNRNSKAVKKSMQI